MLAKLDGLMCPVGVGIELVVSVIVESLQHVVLCAALAQIDICKAIAICIDSTYTGTCPPGVVTIDNFPNYKNDYDAALADALVRAGS